MSSTERSVRGYGNKENKPIISMFCGTYAGASFFFAAVNKMRPNKVIF